MCCPDLDTASSVYCFRSRPITVLPVRATVNSGKSLHNLLRTGRDDLLRPANGNELLRRGTDDVLLRSGSTNHGVPHSDLLRARSRDQRRSFNDLLRSIFELFLSTGPQPPRVVWLAH
jgi:hypothetical protein